MELESPAKPRPDSRLRAHGLREQAASCRRLAAVARTRRGSASLNQLADHFDDQACKLDPMSVRR